MKNTTRFAALSLILAAGLLAGGCAVRSDEGEGMSAQGGKAEKAGCCTPGGSAEAAKPAGCCGGDAAK